MSRRRLIIYMCVTLVVATLVVWVFSEFVLSSLGGIGGMLVRLFIALASVIAGFAGVAQIFGVLDRLRGRGRQPDGPMPGRGPDAGIGPRIPLVEHARRAEHFTGRGEELGVLLEELQPGRTVTLWGPGGVGKSALAAEALWTLAPGREPPECFPDGIVLHDFYRQSQAAAALEAIARAYREEPQPTAAAAARRVLAVRCALIVLDGAENADDLEAVLSVTDSCGVLITTRRREDIRGTALRIEALENPEGVDLLQAWAGERAADEEAASRICTLAGALPLAIRLAGSYMASHQEDAADYLDWLESTPLAALDFGERQRDSVAVLLERSVGQLSEGARAALGVAGRLTLDWFGREAVAAALGLSAGEVGRLLAEGVNYALLQRPEERYQVTHALIHSYAGSRIAVAGEAVGNLAAHYAALAREQTPEGAAGFAVLDGERLHVMAVLTACQDEEQWEPLQDLAWAVYDYLERQGHWVDWESANQARLAAARALGQERNEAAALNDLGIVYRRKGEWERAIGMYEQSLEVSERVGDVQGMAQTYNNLGVVYADQGEWERAIRMYEQSLEIAERVGDVHGMAQTLGNLGVVYKRRGEWERAIEYYNKDLEISERLGDAHGIATTSFNLGLLHSETGEPEKAKALFARAYRIYDRIGAPDAHDAFSKLAGLCGSGEAAHAFLATFTPGQPDEG